MQRQCTAADMTSLSNVGEGVQATSIHHVVSWQLSLRSQNKIKACLMNKNKIGPLVLAQLIMEQEGPTIYCLWMNVRECVCVCVCVYAGSQAVMLLLVATELFSPITARPEARSFA